MKKTSQEKMDSDFWRSRERLIFIEQVAYWRGQVCRADVTNRYRISGMQASTDLQRYLKLNPDAIKYDMSVKRYLWQDDAKTVLQPNDFNSAVQCLLGTDSGLEKCVRIVHFPVKEPSENVKRSFMAAVLNKKVLRISYYEDLDSKKDRLVAPVAFGNDGFRWHARCWCYEKNEYRDFPLNRVKRVNESLPLPKRLVVDNDWNKTTIVTAHLNPALPDDFKEMLRRDFQLNNEDLFTWSIQRAMAPYAKTHLETLGYLCKNHKTYIPWFKDVKDANEKND